MMKILCMQARRLFPLFLMIIGLYAFFQVRDQSVPPHHAHDAHPVHHASGQGIIPSELGASVVAGAGGVIWALSKQHVAEAEAALVLRNSADMGKTWSVPIIVSREQITARGDERPALAFGPGGEFYIIYTRPRGGGGNPHIGDIRFVRSLDGGKTFSAPVTVHANRDVIVHAFGSLVVDGEGILYVAWIDSRDKEVAKARQQAYAGNGLYYAVSTDGGKTFKGDYRLADHTCECCRLALALDEQQRATVMWRHIFSPDIRDHAVAALDRDGVVSEVQRATKDDWRINACPHQGPAMSIAEDGTRHQVWFTMKNDDGAVYYAAVNKSGKSLLPVRLGTGLASHADVGLWGKHIAVVWKEGEGKSTVLKARLSRDKGRSWTVRELARSQGLSARPQVVRLSSGLAVAWQTEDAGMRIVPIVSGN